MDWTWINNAIRSIDWPTVANMAVVISAIFVIRQLTEMRRTTQAQAYSTAVGLLLDEKVRLARRTVFYQLQGKATDRWSKEEIDAAEITCFAYDAIGQMVRYGLLAKNIILESWGASFSSSWPILGPLIHQYRRDFDAMDVWQHYEWLAGEAKKTEYWRLKKQKLWKQLYFPHRGGAR